MLQISTLSNHCLLLRSHLYCCLLPLWWLCGCLLLVLSVRDLFPFLHPMLKTSSRYTTIYCLTHDAFDMLPPYSSYFYSDKLPLHCVHSGSFLISRLTVTVLQISLNSPTPLQTTPCCKLQTVLALTYWQSGSLKLPHLEGHALTVVGFLGRTKSMPF